MPTPSLLIVPSRWKTGNPGKLYSQIPTNGNGDFNVTGVVTGGTSIGTRVNNLGYIEPITTSGTPRLDYYTSSGVPGCPALLVEPSGTNLAFNSQTWATGNNWAFDGGTTVTATSGTTAPDGTSTANAISPTSGNGFHGLYSNSPAQITYTSGTIYTQSAFFKQGTGVAGRYVQLTYTGGGQFTQNGYANFDLQLGTVIVVSGSSADTNRAARIENYGNGWYRCSFTATCNVSGNGVGVIPVLINASGNTRGQSFAGTVTDTLYGWGAQLETGSVATSYIPTTTGTVTRAAEVISVSGAVSGSIGQTEGTIYAEVDLTNLAQGGDVYIITQLFLDGSNRMGILTRKNGANDIIEGYVLRLGGFVAEIRTNDINPGIFKVAFGYKVDDFVMYVNGSLIGSDTSGGVVAANQVQLGHNNGGGQLNNRIRAAALYTTRLTNADLMLLTMPGNNTYLPQAVWDNYLSRAGNTEVPDCLYTRHADLLDV